MIPAMPINMAEFGDAELRRYLESTHMSSTERSSTYRPGSDSGKIGYMLRLAGALALRFEIANNPPDLHMALSWNERVLEANSDDATKVQVFFNIGALEFEEYKQSGQLSVLDAVIDNFVESL